MTDSKDLFKKFPSIEQFRNVRKNIHARIRYKGKDESGKPILDRSVPLPTLKFVGTEKVHGSCCSVQYNDGGAGNGKKREMIIQSRNRIITPEDDNYGFAKFIHALPQQYHWNKNNIIFHGEFAGEGIQDNVAVSQMEKFFVIFDCEYLPNPHTSNIGKVHLKGFANEHFYPKDIRVFNIYDNKTWEIEIDFNDDVNVAEAIEKINQWTLEVEQESPFALKHGGISGIGEGIVWHCETPGWESSDYWFKTKGEKHSKSRVKTLALQDVEKVKSIKEFVDKYVNEERLKQAWDYLKENKLFDDKKSIPDFMRFIMNDIINEEGDTLLASGLQPKDIGRSVSNKAVKWYFEKIGMED